MWIALGLCALVAVAAYIKARRLSRRLAELRHSYWELRYEQGRLRAALARLAPLERMDTDPTASPAAGSAFAGSHEQEGAPSARAPGQTFVPLSSLKR